MLLQRLRLFLRHKLWFRPALASLFSVAIAAAALLLGNHFEGRFDLDISEESLVTLFGIFASSMLSVATFTVSAIVTAASSASTTSTPRAARFILSDSTAQTVLSAFIAAFIYSICGILALKAFHYGHAGRFILFIGLIAIVIFVLLSFINWVDHVMKLGRLSNTIERLHDAALSSLTPKTAGALGANTWDGAPSEDAAAVFPDGFGYVVDLGLGNLQELACENDCQIYLFVRPGEHVETTAPIAYVMPADAKTPELASAINGCIVLGSTRESDSDVRFNILNLTETADRALSPAVNDPGTAVNILNVLVEVIEKWAKLQADEETHKIAFDRLHALPLTAREIVNDAFTPIARDGAGSVEIGVRLQKVLRALKRMGVDDLTQEADAMSKTALELSDAALIANEHNARVHQAAKA
ncbi:MAG: DUF2254 domain-containing protein [Hyphomicrobium sp.]